MKKLLLAASLCSTLFSLPAVAGPYTDDLTKCLLDSTNEADQKVLLRWVFMSIALHPDISALVSVSETQLDDANKHMAQLYTRLFTADCKQQTRQAYRYEGQTAISQSFNMLGQASGKSLFTHPNVSVMLTGLIKHADIAKIGEVLVGKD